MQIGDKFTGKFSPPDDSIGLLSEAHQDMVGRDIEYTAMRPDPLLSGHWMMKPSDQIGPYVSSADIVQTAPAELKPAPEWPILSPEKNEAIECLRRINKELATLKRLLYP